MKKSYITYTLLLFFCFSFSQTTDYSSLAIDESLTEDANAVIRESRTTITISAYNKMVKDITRVVTVLNSKGERYIDAAELYNDTRKIKKLEVKIFDKNGKQIKRIKKNDFRDVSAVDGGTMYSDNRVKYLEYTAVSYPYTVEYTSQVEYSMTAFITGWLPLEGYEVSTEHSKYEIINTSGINLASKQTNFEGFNINQESDWVFVAENLKAIKREVYSPDFRSIVPYMKVALEEFDMKGLKGSNKDWNDFGKWMNDKLISNTRNLPQEVIDEVRVLVSDADSDLEKAKRVYQYVQDKTRYISVQVGIGGWKPIIAEDVDRLGYGDCKGLSNYTKALLEAVDVPAYYTVIYGGRSIRNMDKEFSVTEGNHVILAVPHEEDYIWLECTSQTTPFGYIANFTDDRDALLITPEGGKIIHTKTYEASDNLKHTTAEIELSDSGDITGHVNINTEGTRYYFHSSIERKTPSDQKLVYKEDYWEDINRLEIENIKLSNDKDEIRFSEEIEISASNYAKNSGGRFLFSPNFFNKLSYIPPRDKNRIYDIKIDRGITDKDYYTLKIPENTTVEAIPKPVEISNEFGSYKYEVAQEKDNIITVKRELTLNKGLFDAASYNDFRSFRKAIAKADKSKIVLKVN
ncbi:DUF3857 domain-containing protein [Winogradskyella sp. 3972H.M.0a.05]|uniref:DUF3857 domain-containing protein n=1 Tax=Winogradskyella sp. 3972H.M.0a.05 TaxID=2950277 RepID=UPI003395812D